MLRKWLVSLTCSLVNMPSPNIVTYTSVLSGLVARHEAFSALNLFENEILPLVTKGDLTLDAQALQAVATAWIDIGEVGKAVRVAQFFGRTVAEESDQEKVVHPLPITRHCSIDSTQYSALRGSVYLDTTFLNVLLVALARHAQFNTFWSIYTTMETIYGVLPDEVTLAILGKAAISAAVHQGRGTLVPATSEDIYRPHRCWAPSEGKEGQDEDGNRPVSDHVATSEWVLWDGMAPHVLVRQMFWTMLQENYPLVADRVRDSSLSTTRRLFLGFGRASETDDALGKHTLQTYAISSSPAPSPRVALQNSHLVPTPSNMHMFIALLGYFDASREIPLVLSYMRELSIKPTRKTLCLALWRFEEGGAYTAQMRQLRSWIEKWLGADALPSDDEIGTFRRRQYGISTVRRP